MVSTGLRTRNNQHASSGGLARQAILSPEATSYAAALPVQTTQPIVSVTSDLAPMQLPTTPLVVFRPSEAYSANALTVGNYSLGSNTDFLMTAGIHAARPEIVSMFDFCPTFDSGSETPNVYGELLEVQTQARALRRENVLTILAKLRTDPQARAALSRLESNFIDQISTTEQKLDFLFSSALELEAARKSFDIKDSVPSSGEFLSIKDFFVLTLGFTEQAYNSFSNTKIIYQLIYELNAALENYSSPLIGTLRQSYQTDTNPINILKRSREKSASVFDVTILRSENTPKNAASLRQFRLLANSLPQNIDEKIKILFSVLSKELIVSKGLGESRDFLLNVFNTVNTGNPFDDILGVVGDSILDLPKGAKSFAILMQASNENTNVLPFETKFIEAGTKTFVPGSVYFVDQIIAKTDALDTGPITKYTSDFNSKFGEVKTALNKLLNNAPGVLGSQDIYSNFGLALGQASQGLVERVGPIDARQALGIAVFKAANTDQTLKLMLFQFLLFSFGLDDENESYKRLFQQIISTDIKTVGDVTALAQQTAFLPTEILTEILANNSSGIVSEMLTFMASAIEDRLFELYGNSLPSTSTNNSVSQLAAEQLIGGGNQIGSSLTNVSSSMQRTSFGRSNVAEMLMSSVRFNFLTANSASVFNHFTAELLASSTSSSLLQDDSGRTRLNLLSTSTMCSIIYELFIAFNSKYSSCEFERSTTANTVQVVIDLTKQAILTNLYQTTAGTSTAVPPIATAGRLLVNNGDRIAAVSETIALALGELEQSFHNLGRSIVGESKFINNVIYIFDTVNSRLSITREHLVNFFVTNRSRFGATYLGESQIKTSKAAYAALKKNIEKNRADSTSSPFLDSALTLGGSTQKALNVLLRGSFFKDDSRKRIKLLSVGIPNGFAKGIYQHLQLNKLTATSFSGVADLDLFRINVFKRNAALPEVVYKPKQFIVDLSLFVVEFPEQVTTNLNEIIKDQITYADYELLTAVKIEKGSVIVNAARYSGLSNSDKSNLLLNHLTSYLLNLYIQLLTGLDLAETTFLAQEPSSVIDTAIKDGIQQLLQTYIRNFPVTEVLTAQALRATNTRINSLVSQLDLSSLTQNALVVRPAVVQVGSVTVPAEILEFLQTFASGSIVSGHKTTQERFLSAKLFDRVFTLPVDTESFELDMDAIQSQQSGLDLLERRSFFNKIKEKNGAFALETKNRDEIIFDDYFVTVEPMNRRI
jgi:hypothetical protein